MWFRNELSSLAEVSLYYFAYIDDARSNTNQDYVGLGMYRERKKVEFPEEYYIWIWEQKNWEVDQEIVGKMRWERMEE